MTPLPAEPSLLLELGFIILSLALVGMFTVVLRSPRFFIGAALWMTLTGVLAGTGFLSDFSGVPPRVFFVLLFGFGLSVVLGMSKFGDQMTKLPLAFLVGYQAFRIPVEVLIHQAAVEGVGPPQMSWNGMNFDIVSGLTALLLCRFVDRVPRVVVLAWNTMSLLLLAWVVGVAVVSFPTQFQKLEPANIWVAHFPFVWLPAIAVTSALLGHVVVFRKLMRPAEGEKL